MFRGIAERFRKTAYPVRITLGKLIMLAMREQLIDFTNALQLQNSMIYKAAAFAAAHKLEGDYLEFGVYAGNSFTFAFRAMQQAFMKDYVPGIYNTEQDCIERHELGRKIRFFAFDSFQGLPMPAGIDSISGDFSNGQFSCTVENFKKNIARQGVPLDRVIVVPGYFGSTLNEETVRKYDIKRAAIVYIDSDLYESAKIVLQFITPLLQDGTIIIFDDWYCFRGNPNFGEQKACAEWLDSNPDWILTQYQKESSWRNSFIANEKLPRPKA